MKKLFGIYNYSAAAEFKPLDGLKRVSNGKIDVFYDDSDVCILKNDISELCIAKDFLPDKTSEAGFKSVSLLLHYSLENEKLTVSRGIFGAVPFYFYDDGKALFFSTHIGILADFSGGVTEINALDSYFTHKSVMSTDTIYKNIYALKSGETLKKNGKKEAVKEAYESVKFKPEGGLIFKESAAFLKEKLASSLSSILDRNPKTAVFLSGGLDSNITASLAVKQGVSISSPFYDNEIVGFSQKIPEKFKTDFFGGKKFLKKLFPILL